MAPVWLILALALGLLVARLLSASYGTFYEGDEISIAAGVAGIARDNAAHLYRYGPQVGYYRLVQGLSAMFGGIPAIPVVMVSLSVLAGTVIPILGLFGFRSDLTRAERWLLAGTLAANPIIWTSSRYGNTAMPAAALVVAAVVILSNRPNRVGELAALALFGTAILVRADSVLATGAIGVLLWRNHGAFVPAAVRVSALGIILAVIYGALFAWDPYMQQILGDVQQHLTTNDRTRFFEFLIWAISPFPLAFAILGLRDLEPARRWLLATIVAWCTPSMGFYFTSTTTPRYFILPAFAVAIAAAVGMYNVARLVPRWPRIAWAVVLATASLHLFVGLSNFYADARRGWLTDARTGSHDGDVLAGAFLYNSYVQHDVRNPGIAHPRIGSRSPVERSYAAAMRQLQSGAYRGERILLVFSGGEGHAVHYFVQQADADVVDKNRRYAVTDAVTYDIGGARLTAIGVYRFDGDSAPSVPVEPGDVVWLLNRTMSDTPDTEQRVAVRMPPGLTLGKASRLPDAPMLWSYRVQGTTS
ncbi:MAG TPA: hypothetical protein VJ717_18525 [Gemmatimonadaceae bacterium]|nr:hypothetical protein [Gemmatimonadaceae bacterium]